MNKLIDALNFLKVSELTYTEWIEVGMALRNEGYSYKMWDAWSRSDKRYHDGECEEKWETFKDCTNPVKAGTIIRMALDRGWKYVERDQGLLDWDDSIGNRDSAEKEKAQPKPWNPVQELIIYLENLFEPDDMVGYVTGDVYQKENGRWVPGKGVYNRRAGELITSLKKYPNDIGATVGDWKQEAGGWIRFNPLDGNGIKNENVTRYKYALVESDTVSIPEQESLLREFKLPIAVMINSGGKSIHAIVRVDAPDYEEYKKRVHFLYSKIESFGMDIDKQNKNPSRMTRMPGLTRGEKRQYIVATNIGKASWDEWVQYIEEKDDNLPALEPLSAYRDNPPELPEELISGILRRGHKMLISGSSKAGKSFLLMELCIAIAEGSRWLGFQCEQGKVLYVNLEIDPASCVDRFLRIYDALGIPKANMDNIVIWNLRGHAIPLDKLVPRLVSRIKGRGYDAVVIDPIYKVITGDENSASEMGQFCNQFDKICAETGCASIYCHHHSKGVQGAKKAMDRASGSGVFARDPDAQLDIIQLELTEAMKNHLRDGNATAWRLESSLREFPNITPVNFWFEYPIHRVDDSGELEEAYAEGSTKGNLAKNRKNTTAEERKESIESAYNACLISPPVTIDSIAEYLAVTPRCVRDRLKEIPDRFWVKNGIVGRTEKRLS